MASKKLERVLVTFDKNIYLDSRKYRFFEDAGLIYLTSRGSSYDLYPKEIEERLKKLFSVIISRDDYFNVKMKLSDNQVEIKNRKGEIRRIRL